MKKLLFLCATLALALAPVTALAATDFTGTWTGDMKAPDGSAGIALSFTFKQDGSTLTGSIATPQGDPIVISDGKVDGNTITFKVSFNGMTINHTGTLVASPDGDTIKLETKSDSADFPASSMTLKRAAAAPKP